MAGSDFLQLDLRQAPRGGRATWLTAAIRDAIADGRLAGGDQLPPTRVLATELGASRGVVAEAYQRLADEGLVLGRGRGGTQVVGAIRPRPTPIRSPDRMGLAAPATTAGFEALRIASAAVDLSPGLPDLSAFPRTAWLRAERSVLTSAGSGELGYGNPQGTVALRTAVSRWIARTRGVQVTPDGVIIVAGVAQALSLLARRLTGHGVDAVAVEDPGSLGARQQLQAWGLRTPPVPVDADGLDVDALTRTGARVVMTTPAHQFPTGVVLHPDRRQQLLGWAAAGGQVIEDDYDAEHRYDRHPVAALAATRPEAVYYTGSVSKLLAPALRIGWIVPPADQVTELVAAKRDTDLGNATLPQLVLAELMGSGDLERHLRLVRVRHQRRRDHMVGAISRLLPDATVHGAAAGLHLTVTFDHADPDAEIALAEACLADGVKVQPLSWHRQGRGPAGLVLGYAAVTPTAIATGIETIARHRLNLG